MENYEDELSSYTGLLLKCNRIIAHGSMQSEIKAQMHCGHHGIEKCTNHESGKYECVFWPGHKKRNRRCYLKLQYMSQPSKYSAASNINRT